MPNQSLTFLLSLFPILGLSFSQVDSLSTLLQSEVEKENIGLLYNQLAQSYRNISLDSAKWYARKGMEFSRQNDFLIGETENEASLADFYIDEDSLLVAMKHYQSAVQNFMLLEMKYDAANIYKIIGNIYLSQNNYSEALIHYQLSQEISEKNEYDDILPHLYNNMALIYQTLGEEEKEITYFEQALSAFNNQNKQTSAAFVLLNLGDFYQREGDFLKADQFYRSALNVFEETNNFIDACGVYIILANNLFQDGQYDRSLDYLLKGQDLFYAQNVPYLGPKSLVKVKLDSYLGRAYIHSKNYEKGISLLNNTLSAAKKNSYRIWIEFCAFHLSNAYEQLGDAKKALDFYKVYESYGDSILNESSIKKITQLEMQYEFDQKIREKELEVSNQKAAQQKKELIYLLILLAAIFLTSFTILLYINQRNKSSKIELQRKNLALEHDQLQQKLDHKDRELATNVMFLLKKNEFITYTAERLAKLKKSLKKDNQVAIQQVIRELLQNTSKDVWKEFELRFQEVHSEFYFNLNKQFPDLTPNEKKICAFLRLNMSTKDISAITYQSPRSIDMARFRLRKKMELESDENLINYLANI